ncbi:MAG: type III-A CRISPR-associated protein Cas10/Csm1 [Spirochaetota bacterium]
MKKEYYEIIIASLLHDIGKFKERAFEGKEHAAFPGEIEAVILPSHSDGRYSHRHALWTYDFFENDCKTLNLPRELDWIKIKNLAAKHHNASTPDESIIDMADKISAASDRSDETDYVKGGHFKRHLQSVFTRISLGNSVNALYGYNLKPLAPENVYPFEIKEETTILADQYKTLWDNFIKDLQKSLQQYKPVYGLNQFVYIINSLLQKYCWCIPSATNDKYRDISLYDHAITTAAIALVLKVLHDENCTTDKPFLFFAGDLSGIQQFIFQHQQKAFPGSSKIIRGRSLYVSMISHAYSYALCEELGIPPFVQIMNAGGKFTLILPNMPRIKEAIKKFTQDADNWFFDNFHGDFTIVYDYSTEASQDDMKLSNFKNLIKTINYTLALAKSCKFYSILKNGKCIIDVDYGEGELCKSCGRYSPIPGHEDQRCNSCEEMFNIGSKITKNSIVIFSKKQGDVNYFNEKISMSIVDSLDFNENIICAFSFAEDSSLPFLMYNNYVPQKDRTTLEFKEIAESAIKYQDNNDSNKKRGTGSAFLSYIKLDVDNMGSIFSQGIQDLSISRYVTLSRMFNVFFNLVIKDVLQKQYPNIYTVFSGGDDLFVIAPWNQVIEFMDTFEKKFKEFVCNHPDLHFSTGTYIQKPDYPMTKCAFIAEEKLKDAKDAGRNRVHYFNVITYDQLRDIHQKAKWFIKQNNNDKSKINHSFLYRLLQYSRMANKVYSNKFKPSEDLIYIPYFKYDVSRNIIIKENGQLKNADELQELEQCFEEYSRKYPYLLETIISIALYETREKEIHN